MSEEVEEWRPVVGYGGLYEVSSAGNVRSIDREVTSTASVVAYGAKTRKVRSWVTRLKSVTLAQTTNRQGYAYVGLYGQVADKAEKCLVHRLVAEAFLGSSDLHVNHKDGIKSNNSLDNLEFVTRSENARHAHGIGLSPTGQRSHLSTISNSRATCVCEMIACGMTRREIREMTGIKESVVNHIYAGRAWNYIPRTFEWQRTAATALETMSTTLGKRSTTASSRTPVDDL